jgi:lysylphosphatidylglycerol synthetase-like protein (DUF2156 family)
MKLLRGVAAILAFLTGLITLASALYSLALTAASAEQTHQPIDFAAVVVGLVASAIGILCLFLSHAIDSERGPVLSYRERRRKPRTHKPNPLR